MLEEMFDQHGQPLQEASGSGRMVSIRVPVASLNEQSLIAKNL